MPKGEGWRRARVFPHGGLASKGQVGYSPRFEDVMGALPSQVLLRLPGNSEVLVLRAHKRSGPDVDLALAVEDYAAIANTISLSEALEVEYKPAATFSRLQHTRGALLTLASAVAAWLATIAAALLTFLRFTQDRKPQHSDWLLWLAVVILAAAAVAATLKLVKDLRDSG